MCVRSLDDADCDWIRKDLTIARNQVDDCGVPARLERDRRAGLIGAEQKHGDGISERRREPRLSVAELRQEVCELAECEAEVHREGRDAADEISRTVRHAPSERELAALAECE